MTTQQEEKQIRNILIQNEQVLRYKYNESGYYPTTFLALRIIPSRMREG